MRWLYLALTIGLLALALRAGAASALVGFWQMMSAAIAVWLTATVSHDAMFALGIVLTVTSLLALGLYTMRAKTG
jgi:DHA1 family bicyclomycin/chloramphenicol resistance-like MFS transporter